MSQSLPVAQSSKTTAKPSVIKQQGWCIKEQDDFLLTYLPKYRTTQVTWSFDAFWKEVDTSFNNKWPPEDIQQ